MVSGQRGGQGFWNLDLQSSPLPAGQGGLLDSTSWVFGCHTAEAWPLVTRKRPGLVTHPTHLRSCSSSALAQTPVPHAQPPCACEDSLRAVNPSV